MTRQTVMRVSGINVVIPPPHKPERYIEALQLAAKSKKPIPTYGDYHSVLQSAKYDEELGVVVGNFYRFFNLDALKDWYDIDAQDAADPEDVKESVSIPDRLKPHMLMCPFVFIPKDHLLFYLQQERASAKKFSPRQAKKLLDGAFAVPEVFNKFGLIETTILPDPTTVDEILTLPKLQRLVLRITSLNTDQVDADYLRRLEQRMETEGVGRIEETLVSRDKDKGIEPDDERKKQAAVAARFGELSGVGEDPARAGVTVRRSTLDRPLSSPEVYNHETQSILSVLRQKAYELAQLFTQA